MIAYKKVSVSQLATFFASKEYQDFPDKPISHLRVNSYVNNPRADGTENVLYMAFDGNRLIGYRTLFPSTFFLKNEAFKFIWLSGNWVAKDRRREGISSSLFGEIKKDWDGKIIFANYAPTSKAFYDKTGDFQVLKTLHGQRFYRKSTLTKILHDKFNYPSFFKPFIQIVDAVINGLISLIRPLFIRPMGDTSFFEKIKSLDQVALDFITDFKSNELFNRGLAEFNWIIEQPWVKMDSESKEASRQYHFSVYAVQFENSFYKIYAADNATLVGLVMIKIRDGKLEMPYSYITHGYAYKVAELIMYLNTIYAINHITIYNIEVNHILAKKTGAFLFKKPFQQSFYINTSLLKKYPDMKNGDIQSGDGDGVFT